MYKFAKLSIKEKEIIYNKVALERGLNQSIIEKDYWVCLILDYLFNKSKYKNSFTFKGGTSLSKGFNIIKRFSEDIDLILDWKVLGIDDKEMMKDVVCFKNKFYHDSWPNMIYFTIFYEGGEVCVN